uniref:TORTIFOLIA1/SINE1-2 N-terminal domain-containing protein n=1 Tax=Brassica oleracea var. oleracea TaxID=109376 RepID=A0A0D3DR59_BRAOL
MSLHGRFPASPPVSLSPASSSSPSSHSPSSPDLKQRVIACLNKLADRDTLALAAAELDSIARNLTHDSFSSFLSCIHTTDSSSKSPVRKHSVAVLSLMSRHHGESLSPHLSKMVSTIIRRLRDPDSSVRSACAAATADISAHVTRQPFASVAKPLIETLIQEGDSNVQTGAAVCLAASVEAAADPEPEQLRKSLPKIGEDWAARKSAAEGLSRVAAAEEELAWEYKKDCTAALESRRFDKVKSVRETMNRALSQWKEVANDVDEALLSPCTSSLDVGVKSSRLKKSTRMIKRSPSLPVNRSYVASRQQKENLPRRNVTVSVASREEEQVKSGGPDIIKHTISEKGREDKKVGGFDCGLRSGSRVAPCSDDGDDSCDSLVKNGKDGVDESRKDSEELSLIREQLAMIENQQSSLLDLLQKFMGSSQSGIQSLESRVSGLEMALDEISCDLAVSNGRVPKTSSCGGESCSKLPGAEFLSHKYWRKAEERPMQTRSTASETAAHENSFDQGMQKRGEESDAEIETEENDGEPVDDLTLMRRVYDAPLSSAPDKTDMHGLIMESSNDICSLFDSYLPTNESSSHEITWRMFSTQLRSSSKKNEIKRSSDVGVMQFANQETFSSREFGPYGSSSPHLDPYRE